MILFVIINKEANKLLSKIIPHFNIYYPTSTRRHGNFAGVHTLLRILPSSNSAVLINIKLTQVAKNHFAFATALLWHYSFEIT
jgi:hypothetical protein